MKMQQIAKSCLFAALAALSFSASASMYVGNPTRPDTIWVPGHCDCAGNYRPGHYLEFMGKVHRGEVVWVHGRYDRCGNWVPAHYNLAYKGCGCKHVMHKHHKHQRHLMHKKHHENKMEKKVEQVKKAL